MITNSSLDRVDLANPKLLPPLGFVSKRAPAQPGYFDLEPRLGNQVFCSDFNLPDVCSWSAYDRRSVKVLIEHPWDKPIRCQAPYIKLSFSGESGGRRGSHSRGPLKLPRRRKHVLYLHPAFIRRDIRHKINAARTNRPASRLVPDDAVIPANGSVWVPCWLPTCFFHVKGKLDRIDPFQNFISEKRDDDGGDGCKRGKGIEDKLRDGVAIRRRSVAGIWHAADSNRSSSLLQASSTATGGARPRAPDQTKGRQN